MLNVPAVYLRRPLSVYSCSANEISFLYKTIGKGTKNLSKLKKGENLEVFGPLGVGYGRNISKGFVPVLVAGGTGIASLHYLAQTIAGKGIIFYGAINSRELVPIKDLKKKGWDIRLCTDNGSCGIKGFVTNGLEELLSSDSSNSKYVIYTCGPHLMQEKVAAIAKKYGVPGFASLEEMMACGIGNCQGCAVKINGIYKMACSDGPVFALDSVEW